MPASTSQTNERCPRCGGGFHCGAAEAHCDCFEVKLPTGLRAELAQRYSGCLCLPCLRELIEQQPPPPLS